MLATILHSYRAHLTRLREDCWIELGLYHPKLTGDICSAIAVLGTDIKADVGSPGDVQAFWEYIKVTFEVYLHSRDRFNAIKHRILFPKGKLAKRGPDYELAKVLAKYYMLNLDAYVAFLWSLTDCSPDPGTLAKAVVVYEMIARCDKPC